MLLQCMLLKCMLLNCMLLKCMLLAVLTYIAICSIYAMCGMQRPMFDSLADSRVVQACAALCPAQLA